MNLGQFHQHLPLTVSLLQRLSELTQESVGVLQEISPARTRVSERRLKQTVRTHLGTLPNQSIQIATETERQRPVHEGLDRNSPRGVFGRLQNILRQFEPGGERCTYTPLYPYTSLLSAYLQEYKKRSIEVVRHSKLQVDSSNS